MPIYRGKTLIAGSGGSDSKYVLNGTAHKLTEWMGTLAEYEALKGTPSYYAWVIGTTTYYTLSETPSVGDVVYDSNKNDTSMRVNSVSGTTITFE